MSEIYQVAEIKQLIARSLKPLFYSIEELYALITVEGVVERVASYPSGTYLSLKDAQSPEVNITCLVAPNQKVDFELKRGLKIQVVGTVEMRTKKNNADYDEVILATQLFEVNKGEIAEMEAFRKELQELGYFENKTPIPEIAGKEEMKVGIISSADGVAFRDIENTIKAINFYKLELFPANLYSPEDVANSISEADQREYDLLIVSRGGGSRLDVFNQLPVLKAIKEAKKPVLVAVGHAQDSTLAEEVADYFTTTPTAAGEYLAQLYRAYEIQKKDESVAQREKHIEKLLKDATQAHSDERKLLTKQIEEQNALIKAMKNDKTDKDKLKRELDTLKRRLQSTETAKTTIRLTPGFILFCVAMLAAAYILLK